MIAMVQHRQAAAALEKLINSGKNWTVHRPCAYESCAVVLIANGAAMQ